MVDVEKLREAAEKATPGDWIALRGIDFPHKPEPDYWHLCAPEGCLADDLCEEDAVYLALCKPVNILALLEALSTAHAETAEQARLNGMGGEREAALLARIERLEREKAALRERALEEAAKVAERSVDVGLTGLQIALREAGMLDDSRVRATVARGIAAAIRALKDQSSTETAP